MKKQERRRNSAKKWWQRGGTGPLQCVRLVHLRMNQVTSEVEDEEVTDEWSCQW